MNTTVVGAFVIALGAALIGIVLWLASGGALRKQHDLYLAVVTESVAGLNINAPVKFNGVDVGQVRKIMLDPANPERVHLVFAIERGTPIKTNTVAVLKTQGLTGIAYVELGGGTRDAPPLLAAGPGLLPEIGTRPSLSTRLENVLTSVLGKLDSTSSNIDALLSPANRQALASTLADVATLTRTVAARRDTIDASITNAGRTLDNTAQASAQLGTQLPPVIARIGRGADAMATMGAEVAQAGASAAQRVDQVGADVQRFTADTLPEAQAVLAEIKVLTATLRRLGEQAERNPAGLLFGRSAVPPGPGESTPRAATPPLP